MAPSKSLVALFLALALVANTLQPSEAIRVPVAVGDQEAQEKAAAASSTNTDAPVAKPSAPSAGQVPSFPFPQLPFPFFLFPGSGAPQAGQFPGFPIPLFWPLLPLPGGAPPDGQVPAFPFPFMPLPGAPPAGQGQFPGFPFLPFPLPGFSRPGSPESPPPSSTSTKLSAGERTSPRSSPAQVTDCLPPLMRLMPCMDYLTNNSVPAPPSACCNGFKSLVNDAPICLCHGLNGDINKIMPAPMDLRRMMSLPATCRVALPLQTLAKCAAGPVPPLIMAAPTPGPVTAPSSALSP